jgi:hypothetical protein
VALKGSRGAGLRLGLRFEEWETAVRKRVRKMRIAHLSRLCVNSKKTSQVTSHLLHINNTLLYNCGHTTCVREACRMECTLEASNLT